MQVRARGGLAALITAALAVPFGIGAGAAAGSIEIAPHRAVYDLTLAHASSNSEIADVNGVMTFEWADTCTGWTVDQRSAMTFVYSTGEEVKLAWTLASWEAKDGLSYRFFVRQLQSGEVKQAFRGEAKLDGPGKGGVATYSIPEGLTVTLPPGTMLPTAHSIRLLEAAATGTKTVWAYLFDGTDEAGLFGVGAAMGPSRVVPDRAPLVSSPLTAGPTRHMSVAYFAATGQAAEPEQEQTLEIHDNGVVDFLLLDYGDFQVTARLSEIEGLSRPDC